MGQKPISPLRHRKACVNSVISTHEWSQFRTGVATDSSLEGTGFELVWGFSCQVVFLVCCRFFVRSGKAVLRSVACDQVRGAGGRVKGPKR